MENTGCLYCREQKYGYSWSGADIDVASKIFFGSYIKIVEILEDPFKPERYPKEQVLQCGQCNEVWHLDYYFPDHPPLMVNADRIPPEKFNDFFKKIGATLTTAYVTSTSKS